MSQPPLLPNAILLRVLRVARFDGWSALILGALFTLVMAASREVAFVFVGLVGTAAGTIELQGASRLRRGDAGGMNWLVASQFVMLVAIGAYCTLRYTHIIIPPMPEAVRALAAERARELGLSLDDMFRFVNRLAILTVGVVGLAYQGGMIVYYLRRKKAVAHALVDFAYEPEETSDEDTPPPL